ncbi:MAG: ubiquitin family protein [Leptospirales bacterium]
MSENGDEIQKMTQTGQIPQENGRTPSGSPNTIPVYNAQTGIRFHQPYRRKVASLLKDMEIDPETVLVIQGNTLLTPDEPLSPDEEVEIRPVISGGGL